jgi:hypothetical protein
MRAEKRAELRVTVVIDDTLIFVVNSPLNPLLFPLIKRHRAEFQIRLGDEFCQEVEVVISHQSRQRTSVTVTLISYPLHHRSSVEAERGVECSRAHALLHS